MGIMEQINEIIDQVYSDWFSESDKAGNKVFQYLQSIEDDTLRDELSGEWVESSYYQFKQGFIQGISASLGIELEEDE